MIKLITRLSVSLLTLSLVACSSSGPHTTTSQDKKYLEAKSIPPLRMPPGISSSNFKNYYPVSGRQYAEESKDVNLVPPGLYDN